MTHRIRVVADTITKRYYLIGELAKELNVTCSCIRFWESELGIHTKRNRNGDRRYTEQQANILREVNRLLRVEFYTLKGAKLRLGL